MTENSTEIFLKNTNMVATISTAILPLFHLQTDVRDFNMIDMIISARSVPSHSPQEPSDTKLAFKLRDKLKIPPQM